MSSRNIPSGEALEKLTEYVDLMAKHGPDSPEATEFFDQHKHIEGFAENAKSQYSLEKEDFEDRRRRFGSAAN